MQLYFMMLTYSVHNVYTIGYVFLQWKELYTAQSFSKILQKAKHGLSQLSYGIDLCAVFFWMM